MSRPLFISYYEYHTPPVVRGNEAAIITAVITAPMVISIVYNKVFMALGPELSDMLFGTNYTTNKYTKEIRKNKDIKLALEHEKALHNEKEITKHYMNDFFPNYKESVQDQLLDFSEFIEQQNPYCSEIYYSDDAIYCEIIGNNHTLKVIFDLGGV